MIQKAGKHFTKAEKPSIIKLLISTQCTKAEIEKKYTGHKKEHGQLLSLLRKLEYSICIS